MNITLYKQTKDRDIIEKKLTEAFNFTAYARKEFDIENPVIVVEISAADITKYNYVYIEDFHRYYFINNHRALRTGLYELECEEDYLYTWKESVYSWTVELERAQYDWNLYFKDNAFMALEGHNLNVIEFPNSLPSTKHNIIIVNGGRSA